MPSNRTRSVRRANAHKHSIRKAEIRAYQTFTCWRLPKSWNQLYFRRNKIKRAQKLGKIWPPAQRHQYMEDNLHVLFICSRNRWRSPTAEKIWSKTPGVLARSAGTSRNAKRTVSISDIRWADIICVMEEKHKSRMRAQFRNELQYKEVHVLDIPDNYGYMDAELIELLKDKTEPILEINLP